MVLRVLGEGQWWDRREDWHLCVIVASRYSCDIDNFETMTRSLCSNRD